MEQPKDVIYSGFKESFTFTPKADGSRNGEIYEDP